MVPAPQALQPLGIPTVMRQQQLCESKATTLELILITFALALSVVLSLTQKKRNMNRQPRNPVYSDLIIATAIIFTIATVSVAIATLFLGWFRVISLDALASIVFALGPAFFSIPREILSYSKESLTSRIMWTYVSLNIPTPQFQYIRFIKAQSGKNNWLCIQTEDDQPSDPWEDGSIMVIRQMPNASRHGFFYTWFVKLWKRLPAGSPVYHPRREFMRSVTYDLNERRAVMKLGGFHVHGIFLEAFNNFATFQDIDIGITSWWWTGISSANHLVAKPSIVHMRSMRSMVLALALLSDIVSIGDLVLHLHKDLFMWMLQHDDDIRTAVTSAAGFTCNRIIRELEMDGWESVGPEDLSFSHISPSKYYSLLFLILIDTSQTFLLQEMESTLSNHRNRTNPFFKMPSGQYVLDNLWKARNDTEEEFREVAEASVKEWLMGWGLDLEHAKEMKSVSDSNISFSQG